jgi:hypothetical protein
VLLSRTRSGRFENGVDGGKVPGASPIYVQQQAGDTDVAFTVRVYGSWFPVTAPGTMDKLAAPRRGCRGRNWQQIRVSW